MTRILLYSRQITIKILEFQGTFLITGLRMSKGRLPVSSILSTLSLSTWIRDKLFRSNNFIFYWAKNWCQTCLYALVIKPGNLFDISMFVPQGKTCPSLSAVKSTPASIEYVESNFMHDYPIEIIIKRLLGDSYMPLALFSSIMAKVSASPPWKNFGNYNMEKAEVFKPHGSPGLSPSS